MASQVRLVKQDLSEDDLAHYINKDVIAVDCEMMGLNTYRDRLCLVQLGDESKNVVLVQIEKDQKEAPNLKKLLESDKPLKLFHYARTDLAFLEHWLGINAAPIFCTKIASKLARTYTDKHGLKDLCKEIVGKDLNKFQQSSDWGNDVIEDAQKNYAANDVYHLIPIYKKLKAMLEREGMLETAISCSNFIHIMADLDKRGFHEVLEH